MSEVYNHLMPDVADLLVCLAQVQRGVWTEVPYPYAGFFNNNWAELIGAGVCELEETGNIKIKTSWFKFIENRAKFIWGDEAYDIETDKMMNIGIYKVALLYSKKKPPGYQRYLEQEAKNEA